MSSTGHLTHTKHKTLYTTPNPFEQKFRYHRAVRRGPFIAVSGTTALKLVTLEPDSDASSTADTLSKVHYPGDAHGQAVHIFKTCIEAVTKLGGRKEDVVRVRMFVGDEKDCLSVGDALREVFGTDGKQDGDGKEADDIVGVAATMIVVPGGFVDGEILVEIEVEAYVA